MTQLTDPTILDRKLQNFSQSLRQTEQALKTLDSIAESGKNLCELERSMQKTLEEHQNDIEKFKQDSQREIETFTNQFAKIQITFEQWNDHLRQRIQLFDTKFRELEQLLQNKQNAFFEQWNDHLRQRVQLFDEKFREIEQLLQNKQEAFLREQEIRLEGFRQETNRHQVKLEFDWEQRINDLRQSIKTVRILSWLSMLSSFVAIILWVWSIFR